MYSSKLIKSPSNFVSRSSKGSCSKPANHLQNPSMPPEIKLLELLLCDKAPLKLGFPIQFNTLKIRFFVFLPVVLSVRTVKFYTNRFFTLSWGERLNFKYDPKTSVFWIKTLVPSFDLTKWQLNSSPASNYSPCPLKQPPKNSITLFINLGVIWYCSNVAMSTNKTSKLFRT